MKNKSRLGLDVDIALTKGIQAAIDAHDKTSAIPYNKKLYFLEQRGQGGDNIKELIKASDWSMTINGDCFVGGPLFIPSKTGQEMKQKVNKFVNTNKDAVVGTAYLALGKLVIDTATSRLPKEVGLLGPLAVAELLQVLPFKGEKLEKAKTAALTYAMYVTYYKTDLSKFVEELSGMAEEVVL